MTGQAVVLKDLLGQFDSWGDQMRESLLVPYLSNDAAMRVGLEGDIGQRSVFTDDFKRNIHDFCTLSSYEAFALVESIARIVLAPFAFIGEIGRFSSGSIDASSCLTNIGAIPGHIFSSIFSPGVAALNCLNRVVSTISTATGFLVWHGGERCVRLFTDSPNTVLSNRERVRDIVYHALGITLLSAAAVTIPIAPIQLAALPILFGSLYGTINNQFTVRECPEYYTMGHYYDGTDLKGHAVKTNNVVIKPIVTGCYATTFVTKIAGLIMAIVGTLPYTAAALPVPIAGAMIAGVCSISLVAAHIFSGLKKRTIQNSLDVYARLIGIEWNEANRARTWIQLREIRNERIDQIRQGHVANPQESERFERELRKLTEEIESAIIDEDVPVKYLDGWQANNTRNSIGYLFAGGGTLALTVSTVFLRLFAF